MQKMPPSDEALKEMTKAAEAALASPGEKVIGIVVWALIEGPGGPESARGQLAMYPIGTSDAMLAYLRSEIDRILGSSEGGH